MSGDRTTSILMPTRLLFIVVQFISVVSSSFFKYFHRISLLYFDDLPVVCLRLTFLGVVSLGFRHILQQNDKTNFDPGDDGAPAWCEHGVSLV